MHTTMDGSPPSCSSTTAAMIPSGPCVSPPTSTTDQQREAQGSPKQNAVCAKRPSTSKLKHCNRHMPYPDGSARSPGSCSSDGDSTHSDGEDSMRPTQCKVKRIAANSRERKRMHTVNSAFDQLRELVPTYPSNRKLSKIDTLRLACTYIQDLVSLLNNTTGIQGDDVLYHQPPFSDGFSGYPVTVKQEMVDFQPYPAQEHFRMQHASCLRFASDCPETFTNNTSESDSCTHSPPQQQQQQQPFMQCLPPVPPSSSVAVRPPPLTRTSSEGVTASIHTRMAEASISTSTSNGGGAAGATSVGSLPPLPTAAPTVIANPQPSAASPSPIPSPPMYQRTQGNITSPLAMHSVQHSSVPTPHLIHASLSHHSTTPVWNRPSSIPTPYPVYGQ